MGSMSLMHWLVVLAIVLVLFGAGKLPRVMGDFAKGIKAFKAGMKEEDEDRGRGSRRTTQVPPPAGHRRRPAAAGHVERLRRPGPRPARLTPTPAEGDRRWPRRRRAARAPGRLAASSPNDRLEIRHDPAEGPRRLRARADRRRVA